MVKVNKCYKCLKLFKTSWHLQRHMNIKRLCKSPNNEKKLSFNSKELSKVIQNYPKL